MEPVSFRSNRKLRVILSSLLILFLCLVLITVGTYALFSGKVTVNNHLQAGNLKIELERTGLTQYKLDTTTGYMKTEVYSKTDAYYNYTATSEANRNNVFGISEYAVPTSKYTATLRITNVGTVAFGYWVGIDVLSGVNELARQLRVSVAFENSSAAYDKQQFIVDDQGNAGVFVGSSDDFIGELAINKNTEFTVSVEFVNDTESGVNFDNDNVKYKESVEFDLVVYALQKVKAGK